MSEEQNRAFQALPSAQSCRVIDFNNAQVITLRTSPPRHILIVSGEQPYLNMQVSLVPLVYIQRPDYWGIEVVGCLPEIGLPATAPYVVRLELGGTIGTDGIEVIGANRTEKIDIPGGHAQAHGSFALSITLADSGEPLAEATLTCPPTKEDAGTHPNPAAACEQLTQANGWIDAIPEDPGACTQEFRPVIVAATGTWNGEPRHYKQEFSNRCVAVRATGGVIFDL
ncbi:MAG TPA: SSI family serine proteinase inhibitor [Streptosporangiaceae bacterium]|nr:SSI family serine proteinase inhibitor [Streptosporangiaceae bacterium]